MSQEACQPEKPEFAQDPGTDLAPYAGTDQGPDFTPDFDAGTDTPELEGDVAIHVEDELQMPRLYRVILHNDNYTTMEFVILILVDIFHKTAEEAAAIMLSVHEKGIGVCGVYPKDIAETRMLRVHSRARKAGFPLLCTMEVEE